MGEIVGAGTWHKHPASLMKARAMHAATEQPRRNALRFDVIAGLTAAAVVLPKAMAYATVAGLPVAVGLYTAFAPAAVYGLIGSSRVLSVTSTTTLAILVGAELELVPASDDPARLVAATATLTLLVGALLVFARVLRLGRGEFHFDTCADRLQGWNWPGDSVGPSSETAWHPHGQTL